MLREEIKRNIIDLLQIEFWINPNIVKEESILQNLRVRVGKNDNKDAKIVSNMLKERFEMGEIREDEVAEWKTVKDIVDYIEGVLGCTDSRWRSWF